MIYVITSIFLQCKEVSSAPDILLNQDDKVSTRCNHGYTNFTTTRHVFFRVLNLDHLSFIKKKLGSFAFRSSCASSENNAKHDRIDS